MSDSNYLSVGGLARRVGVTVRTIQYYDQQGLLSPSAKGPQNQRLYTDDDVQVLFRILTLKYLGLSLTSIKSDAEFYEEPSAIKELTDQQMDAIEGQFLALFKRMTTLRALHDEVALGHEVDWEQMTQAIEHHQDESRFFWRLTCIRDDPPSPQGDALCTRGSAVAKWHELIADAIRLMPLKEALDSPGNQSLAKRYLALEGSQDVVPSEDNFILMENIVGHAHAQKKGSFDTLRQVVFEHLEAVAALYQSKGLDKADIS